MKLYYNPISGASFKVRSVLFEVGAEYELESLDPSKGETHTPAYREKNPNGKIPTLDDNGFLLWESNAILVYLALKYPEKGLIPTDARAQALMHQWMHWYNAQFYAHIHKATWESYYTRFVGHTRDEAKYAEGMAETKKNLAVLNKGLEGKEYLAGKLSLADFAIVSNLHVRDAVGLDLTPFPNVKQWVERMEQRESVRKALPPM